MDTDRKLGFLCFVSQCIRAAMVTAAGMASNMIGRSRVASHLLSSFDVLMAFPQILF